MHLQVKMLTARGEQTQDLLLKLFWAYSTSYNHAFADYIRRRKDTHLEGNTLTSEDLINSTKHKYHQLVELGTWNAPTPEEQNLLALETKVAKMSQPRRHNNREDPHNQNKNRNKSKNKHRSKPDGDPEWFTNQTPPSVFLVRQVLII